ncbi:MAG: PP0621 family protein [Burkholderiales bacterium]
MGKIVFWIVVVFVLLFALRLWNSAKARARSTAAKAPPEAAKMVQCVGCGVFLPAPDARVTDEGYRCADPKCAGKNPR